MELQKLSEHLYVPVDFGKHHHYFADAEGDKEYTGITSIIGVLAKPALIGWAAKMAVLHIRDNSVAMIAKDGTGIEYYQVNPVVLGAAETAHTKKKEAAGAHGTDTHALIEEYVNLCLKTGKTIIGEAHPFVLSNPEIIKFVVWAEKNVDHFLFSERRMCDPDPKLFIAGSADFAYVGMDGRRYMADFKTSKGIYGIDYWLQVAAYKMLAEGEGDVPYDGMTIVRLGKDGKFEVHQLFDYETYKQAFLACLTLYRAQAAIKGMVIH